MRVRGAEFTPAELTAKLRSMPPRAYMRNARYVLARPERRLMIAALPRLCVPSMLPRLTGHRDLAALLESARSATSVVAPGGRVALAEGLRSAFPRLAGQAVADAERAMGHEFNLLGSGPCLLGPEIDWLRDFKTGVSWPQAFYSSIDYSNLDQASDVKVPWEVSRCHQLLDLARAHLVAPSDEYVSEIGVQLRSWIAANPVGRTINWACTMEVAIRAVNWVWTLGIVAPDLDDETLTLALSSLLQHGFFTARNLEVSEVAGNHYLSDALGLVALGAFFRNGRLGARWLRQGGTILADELQKQVYPDGVDHEMSIPYHRLVVEIFLIGGLLLRAAGRDPGAAYWERVERMVEFTAAYTRPDGTAPVWGDADDGRILAFSGRHLEGHRHILSTAAVVFQRGDIAAAASELVEDTIWLLGAGAADSFHALRPVADGRRCIAFLEGGFVALRDKSWHALFDAGPVGLRGRGGHGHNDALSVEIWCDGPLIVDPGSYVYTADAEARTAFRSTRAHNAPMLDNHEINDVLGLWRLADQAQAQIDKVLETEAGAYATGHHSGYSRIATGADVHRRVELSSNACTVRDRVSGTLGRWTVRWTFDPSVIIDSVTTTGATLRRGDADFALELAGASTVSVGTTWVSPSYGVRNETASLDVEFEGDECEIVIHAI